MELTEIILALCLVLIIYAIHLSMCISELKDTLEIVLLMTTNVLEITAGTNSKSLWQKIEKERRDGT